jgi:DNA-binding XRE family transcriptional regulator
VSCGFSRTLHGMTANDTPVIEGPATSPHETDGPPPRRQLGREIVARRESHGWTQKDFAHKIDMNVTKLCEIERESINASLPNLVKIANGLGCPVAYLLRDFRAPTC